MEELIKQVVIVGGGTAGWMTAAYLSKAFGPHLAITLIESKNIPKIGVGEATVPNLQRVLFDFLGIPEQDWMAECNASFKGAIKFINWRKPAGVGEADHFYHLFGLIPNCDNVPLSHYWALKRALGSEVRAMDYACYAQPALLDRKLSPRHLDGTPAFPYAWHFDAHLIAAYLARIATSWGVRRIIDEVQHVELDGDGNIAALVTSASGRFVGDLFIDCSGFKGLLINQALREPFLDETNLLLCNSAVACAVPQNDEESGVEPYTSAIAMNHGWTWKIPMLGRFGSGYVYSDSFVSEDEATAEFLRLWNLPANSTKLNHLHFRTGRNRRAWIRNCVAIGLSSCFIEPLESTAIYFICAALYQLAKHFPDKSFDATLRNRFNEEITYMYEDCRDFVQAHYLVSPRRDTPFWRANHHELHLAESMKNKMETYRAGLVVNTPLEDENGYYGHFETEFRTFWPDSSYYCIFAGSGFLPQPLPKLRYRPEAIARAESMFALIGKHESRLATELPTCYEYLRRLHAKSQAGGALEPQPILASS